MKKEKTKITYEQYKSFVDELRLKRKELERKQKEYRPIHTKYVQYLRDNPYTIDKKVLERDITNLKKEIIDMIEV